MIDIIALYASNQPMIGVITPDIGGSISGTTGNSLLAFSSADANFIENGVTKLKITVKAKVALSGIYWGRIVVDGGLSSLGFERIIQL